MGVVYQTPPDQLEKIPAMIQEIVEQAPLTRFERSHLSSLGDSALVFETVYWMLDSDYNHYMDAQQSINLALLRRFGDLGIGFAYPTQSLFIEGPVQLERRQRASG